MIGRLSCYILLIFCCQIKVFSQVPTTKIDAGLAASVGAYAAAIGAWTGSEVVLNNAYRDLEKQYYKLYTNRINNESRKVSLTLYIEASSIYAQSMIRGIERMMANHWALDKALRLTQLTVLLGSDNTNQGKLNEELKYYKQQLELINQVALALIAIKNPNPGKSLYIISLLLNKVGRVIERLGEIVYHLKLVYSMLTAIVYFPENPRRIQALNQVFSGLDANFFMWSALESLFDKIKLFE